MVATHKAQERLSEWERKRAVMKRYGNLVESSRSGRHLRWGIDIQNWRLLRALQWTGWFFPLFILIASCSSAPGIHCEISAGTRSCTDGTWTCVAVESGVCACSGPDGGLGLETTELCGVTAP